MRITFADVLLALPVDATMRAFFERCPLELPVELDWENPSTAVSCLLRALVECPPPALRRYVVDCLRTCARLAQPRGRRALAQLLEAQPSQLPGLEICRDALHRAFWLMVWHPTLFEAAAENEHFARRAPLAQQHDLGVCAHVRLGTEHLEAFRQAVEGFSRKKLARGERCVVRVSADGRGTVRVRVFLQLVELAQRQLACPNLRMVLDYAPHSGVLRTVVVAGEEYHKPLARAFSRHLLGVEVGISGARLATLNLAALTSPSPTPVVADNELVALRVQSITVVSPDTTLRAEFSLINEEGSACVTDLVPGKLPQDNPFSSAWVVVAARLNLYFSPRQGKPRSRLVAVDITRRGRLNLHRFDEPLRAQIEQSLVRLGVLLRRQTLSTHLVTLLMAVISNLGGCAA